MLVSSVLSGGLGEIPTPRLLVAGQDFNCITNFGVATSCYAIKPEVHEAFLDLQRQINRFSKVAGFPTTYVDGKLGADTASALRDAAEYIFYHFTGVNPVVQDYTAPQAKDHIAQQALFVRLWVRAFADIAQQQGTVGPVATAPAAPMPVPSPPYTPSSRPTATTPAIPAAAAAIAPPSSKASWMIASGIGLSIVGGISYVAWRRRKAQR
jgi:hypothetical protein